MRWTDVERSDLPGTVLGGRVHDWPRGYPGDAETVDLICGPMPEGDVDAALWDFVLARGHRNRIKLLARLWEETLPWTTSPSFALLGCGHALDLVSMSRINPQTDVLLVDFDTETLETGRRNVVEKGYENVTSIEMTLKSVPRRGLPGDNVMSCCAGLFDYLKESTCVKILREMERCSTQVVFTNVDETHMTMEERHFMGRVLDWDLHYRKQKTLMEMADAAGLVGHIITDETLTQNIFVGRRK